MTNNAIHTWVLGFHHLFGGSLFLCGHQNRRQAMTSDYEQRIWEEGGAWYWDCDCFTPDDYDPMIGDPTKQLAQATAQRHHWFAHERQRP